MGKCYLYTLLLVLVLLVGCAPTEEQTQPEETLPQITEPEDETPVETTQPEETSATEEIGEIIKIPNDIREILEKGKTRLNSYSYNYKSPESDLTYGIYVKGNTIKIIPPEMNVEEQGNFYNTIYLDTEKKTAEAYCVGYSSCEGKVGKVKDLNYEDAYIETPIDWTAKVKEAEEIDERQVEGRDAVYLETNIGKLMVESYYGFLYMVEDGESKWEFSDAAFNSVEDSDVTPS